MLNLADHPADIGRVLKLRRPVHFVETKADERGSLVLGPTDRRSCLGQFDLRHHAYSATASASAVAARSVRSPRRWSRSTIFLPRRCATDFGEVCSPSAEKVARIMLSGLRVPTD